MSAQFRLELKYSILSEWLDTLKEIFAGPVGMHVNGGMHTLRVGFALSDKVFRKEMCDIGLTGTGWASEDDLLLG